MKFHHIGYAIHSLDKAIESFKALGCRLVDTCQDESRGIAIAFVADDMGVQIELIEPIADENPIKNILKKNGPTPYHLCFDSGEPSATVTARLKASGFCEIAGGGHAPALGGAVKFFYSPTIGIVEIYFAHEKD